MKESALKNGFVWCNIYFCVCVFKADKMMMHFVTYLLELLK